MSERLLPPAILVAGLVLYPVITLACGAPHFPRRGECAVPATAGAPIDAVFGRFDDQAGAEAKQRRITHVGFTGSQIERDGCGYLKVVVHGVPNLAVGHELVAEARRVGLEVTLERAAGS